MSNPAHSVEHIEKQQRSITPQEQVTMRTKEQHKIAPLYFDSKNENGLSGLLANASSPAVQLGTSPLASFMPQSHNVTLEDAEQNRGVSPLASFLETPQKPHLLPPMMFTSSGKEKSDCNTAIQQLSLQEPDRDVPLLTKNQLQQAFAYLLRNDSDFVAKLHEAYVKSVNEKLNLTNGSSMK